MHAPQTEVSPELETGQEQTGTFPDLPDPGDSRREGCG